MEDLEYYDEPKPKKRFSIKFNVRFIIKPILEKSKNIWNKIYDFFNDEPYRFVILIVILFISIAVYSVNVDYYIIEQEVETAYGTSDLVLETTLYFCDGISDYRHDIIGYKSKITIENADYIKEYHYHLTDSVKQLHKKLLK